MIEMYQFIRFCFVGLVALLVQYVSYILFLQATTINISFVASYFVSLIINYLLSSIFTFGVPISVRKSLLFSAGHVINLLLQLLLLNVFLSLGLSKELSPIPTYAITVPTNFLVIRYILK